MRKTSHGQAFNLEELVDLQIATWSTNSTNGITLPPLFRMGAPGSPPAPIRPPDKAAGYVREDVKRLLDPDRAPPEQIDLRAAFNRFLEESEWTCERCDKKVDINKLRVPPPIDGVFHMYCSQACAEPAQSASQN